MHTVFSYDTPSSTTKSVYLGEAPYPDEMGKTYAKYTAEITKSKIYLSLEKIYGYAYNSSLTYYGSESWSSVDDLNTAASTSGDLFGGTWCRVKIRKLISYN